MSKIFEKKFAITIVAILVIVVVGSIFFSNKVNSQKETIDALKQQNGELVSKLATVSKITPTQVELYYNKATGELYPILPDNVKPHTCVWTIWGDHGSQMKLTTDTPYIDNQSNPYIKSNNFLPPRVPIYVTCVDWQNLIYQGTIGEY